MHFVLLVIDLKAKEGALATDYLFGSITNENNA
jgi:hypothetical protein